MNLANRRAYRVVLCIELHQIEMLTDFIFFHQRILLQTGGRAITKAPTITKARGCTNFLNVYVKGYRAANGACSLFWKLGYLTER